MAIASWLEETPDHALRLYQHYQQRGYTWPANKHPDTKFKISTLLLTAGDSLEEEEEIEALTIEEGSPQKDLNLPLETVRKLTTQQEPSQSP